MNLSLTLTALAAVGALSVAGCNRSPESSAGSDNYASSTSNSWDGAKTTATNAWQATKEEGSNVWQKSKDALSGTETATYPTNYFGYDFSRKSDFVTEAQDGMNQLDDRISKLTEKASKATGSTQTDLQQKLQEVNDRRAELSKKYEAVKEADAANWDEAKAAFIKTYFDLAATVKGGEDLVAAK